MHISPRRGVIPASVPALLAMGRAFFAGATADATVEAHRARQAELLDASSTVLAQADAERRELTVEERNAISANAAEVERLADEVALRERIAAHSAALSAPNGRRTTPDAVAMAEDDGEGEPARPAPVAGRPSAAAGARPSVPAQARVANGTLGFRHLGDFAHAVYRASATRGQEVDRRLTNAAATTFSQESVGADGGFAVPPDFRAEIEQRIFGEDSLVARCDLQRASGNTWTAPVDETTPWGTGGVKAYWESEAAAITQSKPSLRDVTVRLHKLASLVPITEEMLEDAPSMDGYLRSKMPEALDWQLSFALAWGTGAGQPLGFMRGGALVTVAAEAGQTTDTIVAENIVKMFARMPIRSRRTAVWLIHPDAEPFLHLMKIGDTPVYMPPGGLSGQPYGTLLGRPVIPHQVCETVGDLGDIMLVDFMQYLAVRKAGGIRMQTSIHLWFDQDMTAFKATMRVAGQPWWSAPISQRDGSNTQSPFVTLAGR